MSREVVYNTAFAGIAVGADGTASAHVAAPGGEHRSITNQLAVLPTAVWLVAIVIAKVMLH